MKSTKLWLSRQRNGMYMVSLWKPHYVEVGKSGEKDFYVEHGEPFGLRNICPYSAARLFGADIKIGESIAVSLSGKIE